MIVSLICISRSISFWNYSNLAFSSLIFWTMSFSFPNNISCKSSNLSVFPLESDSIIFCWSASRLVSCLYSSFDYSRSARRISLIRYCKSKSISCCYNYCFKWLISSLSSLSLTSFASNSSRCFYFSVFVAWIVTGAWLAFAKAKDWKVWFNFSIEEEAMDLVFDLRETIDCLELCFISGFLKEGICNLKFESVSKLKFYCNFEGL